MLKKTISTAAVLLASTFAAAPVMAQDTPKDQEESARQVLEGRIVTVRPERRGYYMDRQSVHEVAGEYRMTDGSHARIRDRNRKLIVDFDDRTTVLEAVGPNQFASSNDDMRLQFKQDASGDDMIVMSYIPARRMAGETTYGSSKSY